MLKVSANDIPRHRGGAAGSGAGVLCKGHNCDFGVVAGGKGRKPSMVPQTARRLAAAAALFGR